MLTASHDESPSHHLVQCFCVRRPSFDPATVAPFQSQPPSPTSVSAVTPETHDVVEVVDNVLAVDVVAAVTTVAVPVAVDDVSVNVVSLTVIVVVESVVVLVTVVSVTVVDVVSTHSFR